MLHSRRFAQVGALALLSTIACSSLSTQGVPTAAPVPDDDRAAALAQPVAPALVPAEHALASQPAPAAGELDPGATPARARPLEVMSQMLTAQALLVSLLLAPLSRDGGELARVDATPDPSSSPLR
jgi:hypothetical protein